MASTDHSDSLPRTQWHVNILELDRALTTIIFADPEIMMRRLVYTHRGRTTITRATMGFYMSPAVAVGIQHFALELPE